MSSDWITDILRQEVEKDVVDAKRALSESKEDARRSCIDSYCGLIDKGFSEAQAYSAVVVTTLIYFPRLLESVRQWLDEYRGDMEANV